MSVSETLKHSLCDKVTQKELATLSLQKGFDILLSIFLSDFKESFSFGYLNQLQKLLLNFSFVYVEVYAAIKRYDIVEAENVCKLSSGNINFSEALTFAVENNMDDVFNIFENYGALFNLYSDMGINLILTAIAKQNCVLCESILRVGISKNTINCPNAIPVLSLVIVEIVLKGTINEYNIFKKYFADTKFWGNLVKQTLIHNVIERKYLGFLKILITDGFNVNSRDNSGNSPVHVAARVGDNRIMRELIRSNAAISATNHSNQGPLHLAAKNGHKEVFEVLMSCDIDDFRDNFGKTAEDYAVEYGHYDRLYIEYLSLYS